MNTQLRHIISIGLLLASFMGSSGAWAVDCPQNFYSFSTQVEVDAFPQDCDSVLEYLTVANTTDITNIERLANLTRVGGYLDIYENELLANLNGLTNLTSVGGYLDIGDNTSLTNIEGLANLDSVGGDLYIYENDLLTNLNGLAKLTSVVGDLAIEFNDALTNIDALVGLTSVGGYLDISDNGALTNCQGIAPVLGWPSGPPNDSVGGSITISNNGGNACDSVSAVLASVSAPAQPIITNTDYGDGEIYLTVSDSGSSPVASYNATCTDGTTEYTGTSSTSRITVSGLTNGVGYSCSVTATNAAGTSTPSASSPPVTPEYIPVGLPIWLLYEASK